MNNIQIINVTFQICTSIMSFGILGGMAITGMRASEADDDYKLALLYNILLMMTDAMDQLLQGEAGIGIAIALRVTGFCYFMLQAVLTRQVIYYQKHFFEQKTGKKLNDLGIWIGRAICGITFVLLVINLFVPFLYTYDQWNQYARLPAFPLITGIALVGLFVTLVVLVQYRKYLTPLEQLTFAFISLVPLLSGMFNIYYRGLAISQMAVSLGIVVLFFIVQLDRGRYVAEQENENIKARTSLALSQIQPHFLFNALNSIQYLCAEEPEQAEEAVSHLAAYLRGNLSNLTDTTPVPFMQEISHVKNYLYIEQIRFPHIKFHYDLQEVDFMLPALTVQPLVENAIRHGLKGVGPGARVTISSWRERDVICVAVEDNGHGFDPMQPPTGDGAHIGIANVRQRLHLLCNGTLELRTAPEAGTRVEIRIPDDQE